MNIPKKILNTFQIEFEDISELHSGENLSWKVANKDSHFVLKRVRNDRSELFSGRGEIAWLVSINSEVGCVSPFRGENSLISCDGHEYLAYNFIDGDEPDYNDLNTYKSAGILLKKLHSIGAKKYKEHNHNKNWPGHKRPTYDFEFTVEDSITSALNSGLLSKDRENELLYMKDLLKSNFPKDRTFIHGDYHLGNLIKDKHGLRIIDFDECGFGSIFYDLGTMRLHTMAANNEDAWRAFLEGYELNDKTDALKFGVASRFIFMIGKIPTRLDVPGLSENASLIMDKYVQWVSDILPND